MSTSATNLKTYFETGDKPTASEFGELVDGNLNLNDGGTVVGATTFSALTKLTGNTGLEAGTGMTGIETYKSWVEHYGTIIKTSIFVDLTGAVSAGGLLDIIGVGAGTANCHIGQYTTAIMGTMFGGKMTCLETPATGEVDLDLYSATVATGAEDAVITGLVETKIVEAAGAWIGTGITTTTAGFVGVPTANDYLYLVKGATTSTGTYTTGKFLIEMWGTA